jgi:hypothetical protein
VLYFFKKIAGSIEGETGNTFTVSFAASRSNAGLEVFISLLAKAPTFQEIHLLQHLFQGVHKLQP